MKFAGKVVNSALKWSVFINLLGFQPSTGTYSTNRWVPPPGKVEKNATKKGTLHSPDKIKDGNFTYNEKPQADANVSPGSEFSFPAVTTEGDRRPREHKLTLLEANQISLQLDDTQRKSNLTKKFRAIESLLIQMNTSVELMATIIENWEYGGQAHRIGHQESIGTRQVDPISLAHQPQETIR